MNQRPFTAGEMPSASAPVLAMSTGHVHSAAHAIARTQCVIPSLLHSRPVSDEAEDADADPYHVEADGGKRAVVTAVDHEADRADHVHPVIKGGLAVDFAGRQQSIGGQDERGRDPPDDFDE